MPMHVPVRLGLSCLLLLPVSLAAQGASDRDLVAAIVRDGPRSQAIRASVEVVRREQLARRVTPNPTLAYTREGAGFTEFLHVEQRVPVLGLHSSLTRARDAAIATAEADRDALLWQLRADAETAVARLVADQDRAVAAEAARNEVGRLVEVLRVREREGEGSRYDRLRAEQELADATAALVGARAGEAAARAAVAAMLPPRMPLPRVVAALDPRSPPPAVDALVDKATASRADVRAVRASIVQSRAEVAATRIAKRPAPSIAAGVKRATVDTSGREAGGFLGISVPIPLFDTGNRAAAVWEASRSRAELQLSFLEHAVRAEIAGAIIAVQVRQQALGAMPAADSGDELARTAEVAYREGEIGILELLDAARTAARARVRAIDLRLDMRLAEIALERAVGDTVWP